MRLYFVFISCLFSIQILASELAEIRNHKMPQLRPVFELQSWQKALSPWNLYKTDSCSQRANYVQNEEQLRELGLRRCQDASVSFIQPNSDGWNGWEGKCGQTAGANSLFHYCRVAKDPDSYIDEYLRDLTPGVRPATLKKGLNKLFKKFSNCGEFNFKKYALKTRENFIAFIKQKIIPKNYFPNILSLQRFGEIRQRQPVMVLVQNPGGKYLHWVTVFDMIEKNNQCHFIVNHWDDQYTVPCNDLADWSYDVGRSYPVILRSYSVVAIEEENLN